MRLRTKERLTPNAAIVEGALAIDTFFIDIIFVFILITNYTV
jgi:hypothetical protein